MAEKKASKEPFDQKQAEFVRLIAEGGTWRSASAELGVSQSTIAKWLHEDDDLAKHYARALEAQGDEYAFRVIETAENAAIPPDEKRVRIDAYKWAAGKRKPKVYGERLATELSGSVDVNVVSKAQRDAAVAAALRADG